MWDTFRPILNAGKKKKGTNIDNLMINANTLTNDNDIANAFNIYFSSIGSNLADSIPLQNITFKSFVGSMNINSVHLFEASEEELLQSCQS